MFYTDTTIELLHRYDAPRDRTLDAAERRTRTAVTARHPRIRRVRRYPRRTHSLLLT
jgi:hypothetical protein